MRETVRNFKGEIVGYIDSDMMGNKIVRNFGGQIVGYYKADRNCTTNQGGQIMFYGDMTSALLK